MNWMASPYLQDLRHFLDLTTYRQSLIAGNIANIDTPNYQAVDFNFQAAMQQAEQALPGQPVAPEVTPIPGLPRRPDGNDVSMDQEALALAHTELQYRMGVSLLTSELKRIQEAINGGGNATS